MKIAHAKTIMEAIDDLQGFLELDMWHAFNEEFKNEEDMQKYLVAHFKILRREIKRL
jgi:hypothetical protein